MKRYRRTIITAVNTAIALALMINVALGNRPIVVNPGAEEPGYEIYGLETMNYDGRTLSGEYTVPSRCKAKLHTTNVDFDITTEEYRRREVIVELHTILYDVSNEKECTAKERTVSVGIQIDIVAAAEKKIAELAAEGLKAAPDYAISLPPVWPATGYGSETKGIKYLKQDGNCPKQKSPAPAPAPTPNTVQLTSVEYAPEWNCTLDKKSSARRNTFTGTGISEAAARNEAMMGCKSTNEPKCYLMALDPAHTTCSANIMEKKVTRQFAAALPADGGNYLAADLPAPKAYWSCVLYKNDGARKDGFTGTGETLDAARDAAASGCSRTNHPKCREFSRAPSHTYCQMAVDYSAN